MRGFICLYAIIGGGGDRLLIATILGGKHNQRFQDVGTYTGLEIFLCECMRVRSRCKCKFEWVKGFECSLCDDLLSCDVLLCAIIIPHKMTSNVSTKMAK